MYHAYEKAKLIDGCNPIIGDIFKRFFKDDIVYLKPWNYEEDDTKKSGHQYTVAEKLIGSEVAIDHNTETIINRNDDLNINYYEKALITGFDFSSNKKILLGTVFIRNVDPTGTIFLKRARLGEDIDKQVLAMEDLYTDIVLIDNEGRVINYDSAKIKKNDKNYGGDTDYYRVPENATMLQDLIEYKKMNFAEGNIFKATYRLNDGDHDKVRELNKIIWFAEREKKRIEKEK